MLSVRQDLCPLDNDYDGRMGLRISSIFVILLGSAIGVFFPVISSRTTLFKLPWWCFFTARYFGSGVIISTAFIHLLAEAAESLTTECLGGTFLEYPWAEGICLMALFAIFLSELIAHNMIDIKIARLKQLAGEEAIFLTNDIDNENDIDLEADAAIIAGPLNIHAKTDQDGESIVLSDSYYTELLNIFILEFGILFHSVFVGLTLAVSGNEFITLYVVLIFHQMFEGFGLGSRIATTNFGSHKKTPWVFCTAFSFITPMAIAVGLGVRTTYLPGSRANLITRGVFDSISAGVLIYTSLVELIARDFLFSDEFKKPGTTGKLIFAYVAMCCGCALMALIGKWA